MIKKLLVSILITALAATSLGFLSQENKSNGLTSAILQWQLISGSQSKDSFGKPLDCSIEDMKQKVSLAVSNKTLFEEQLTVLEKTDPGKIKDIKGCVLENQMDGIIKWIVYVAIMGFAMYSVIIALQEVLGGSKGSSDSYSGNGMGDSGGGSGSKILEKVKTPLWAIAILILITLGVLNVVVKIIGWAFSSLS